MTEGIDRSDLRSQFDTFRESPLRQLELAIRRRRVEQLRLLLADPERLTLDVFNREVWNLDSGGSLYGEPVSMNRLFFQDELPAAGIDRMRSGLEDGGLELHGNCMWGSATKVFGPMLSVSDERRAEYVRQAARIVSDDGLSATEKAEQLLAIDGFGPNIATGLVMVFHVREFMICNKASMGAVDWLGLPVSPLDAFERSAHELREALGAADFLELDLFLWGLRSEHWEWRERAEGRAADPSAATVWVVRAGNEGVHTPAFINRSAAIVPWGETGDISGLSRAELVAAVNHAFPADSTSRQRQAVNALSRLLNVMADGDVVVTPEPASQTVLFGWVDGPYSFLADPIADGYRHARSVRWFARVSRDELSLGARKMYGSLLTTRPTHEAELLRLANLHASDAPPDPLVQRAGREPADRPAAQRVTIGAHASVPAGAALSEFQTGPRRMVQLLDELDNGQLALPDFQRSFVWAPDATRELLVSIIRSFPAGALLFLQGGGTSFQSRSAEEAPPLHGQPSHLVLDGQQRLTSLYQAMFGLGQSRFFLDIGALIAGADISDAVQALTVERAAAFSSMQAQADALMMPASVARDGGAGRWRDDVVDLRADDDPSLVRALLRDVERAYIDPLVHYAFPVTVLPASTELEAVCTIFETLNRTGKPLSTFELISARAFAGGLSLRDYWNAALADHPVLDDFALEPYYLLQVIALRLGISCKRRQVLKIATDEITAHWDDAVRDMAAAVNLLRDECGVLTPKWLPYRPMLIPLAAAWRAIAEASGPDQGAMRAKLKRWFWCTCFNGEYESSSTSLAERDAPALRSWLTGGNPPPVVLDFNWDAEGWRSVTVRQKGLYQATIALTLRNRPRDFHTAAPLTQDLIATGKIDDHHVFPRGFLADLERGKEADTVLNHALIDRATNVRIGKKAPSVYLSEIRASLGDDINLILESHLLPHGARSPLAADDYDEFINWRLNRLDEALAGVAGRAGEPSEQIDPARARLDARIETVELALRRLIVERLGDDPSLMPGPIAGKVIERIRSAARRHPGTRATRPSTLSEQMEFLDVRELEAMMIAKTTWAQFESTFASKQALSSRFDQLAELRNGLRHSRTINDVTMKDGEAALLWFARTLRASKSAEP